MEIVHKNGNWSKILKMEPKNIRCIYVTEYRLHRKFKNVQKKIEQFKIEIGQKDLKTDNG